MDNAIAASYLNDFVFCPASIYFHRLYGNMDTMAFQSSDQVDGTNAHITVDNGSYSKTKDVITSLEVYSEKYNIVCKIDSYNLKTCVLRERKKKIKQVYDGYVYQVYAQYFGMMEMGYGIKCIELYSMDDNMTYPIPLPQENKTMLDKFERVIREIMSFDIERFEQNNVQKCKKCIYEPICDRSLKGGID